MTTDFDTIRDKDHLILQHIDQGDDDVQQITAETTLENYHVTYALEKLEELGLITVKKPDGMVERVIDGEKRVFQHPKQAELTEKGEQYLEHADNEDLDEYENLSHEELVEKVHELEHKVEELEKNFEVFRNQVLDKIN
jgi:DNA-binding MarR family transcriptional regulator